VSSGITPDLRYASESTHKMFQAIVRGGALREYGMPSFSEDLTFAQVRAIEGYVLSARVNRRKPMPRRSINTFQPAKTKSGPVEIPAWKKEAVVRYRCRQKGAAASVFAF